MMNKSSELHIIEHLSVCDENFLPPLSHRVNIKDYAKKLKRNSIRFEAWSGNTLIGMVAIYCNDNRLAYISSVSVLNDWTGKGIARKLMRQCIENVKKKGVQQLSLEVNQENFVAIELYEKSGFIMNKISGEFIVMNLFLDRTDKYV